MAEIKAQLASRREVSLPSHVAPELAAIIRKAMAVAPADRFETVGELREALDRFLEHRTAVMIAQRGDDAAAEMTRAHEHNDAETAERAFFDAAFNYRASLESWPEHEGARERLNALVHERVEQLIALNAPLAARRALAIVQSADPGLHARVEEAVSQHERDRYRLRDYERGDDRVFGLQTRRMIGLVLGGIWIGLNVVVVALPVTSLMPLLIGAVACLVLSVLVLVRQRHVMLDVRLSRYLAAIALVAQVAQIVQLALGAFTGRPVAETLVELMLLWSVAAACTAVVVDARIFPTALTYMAGYIACRLEPSLLTYVLPGGATIMLVVSHTINVITARRARETSANVVSAD